MSEPKKPARISNAPPPITPLRGGSWAPPKLKPARWQVWRLMPSVALWQAVCLSLDIEPDEHLKDGATRVRSDHSRLPADYWDRLMVCLSNLSVTHGPIRVHGPLYRGMKNPNCSVLLSEIAAFAIDCAWPIPDAMKARVPSPAGKPAESKEERQDRRLLACESAGLLMPNSDVGRLPDGIGRMAEAQGTTRQAFSDDIRAALARRVGRLREGKHR